MKKQLFVLLITVACLHKDIFPTKCPCPFSYLCDWMYKKNADPHKKNDADIELTEILVSSKLAADQKKYIDPAILQQPFEPRRTAQTPSSTYIPESLRYVIESSTIDNLAITRNFRKGDSSSDDSPKSNPLLKSPTPKPADSSSSLTKNDSEGSWDQVNENDM